MYRNTSVYAFQGRSLQQYFSERNKQIGLTIRTLSLDAISNLDEGKYIEELVKKFTFHIPIVRFQEMKNKFGEMDNPRYDSLFNRRRKIETVIYYISYKDVDNLLRFNPGPNASDNEDVTINGNNLCFEIPNTEGNEQVIKEKEQILNKLQLALTALNENLEAYNKNVNRFIIETLEAHKHLLIQNKSRLNDLL